MARPPSDSSGPRVVVPTRRRIGTPAHPWKKDIVATVFWIGEKPTTNNPTPNDKSSWDVNWEKNYGGYDSPDKDKRCSNYCPVAFTPGLNPFYIALPYNDVAAAGKTKPEAAKVIPWYNKTFTRQGRTVLKSRWVAIEYGGRICYAQWEDCGPFRTDDWKYVFGNSRPANHKNKGAGIDVSPAVRDFLRMPSGAKVNWRFAELNEVESGPWTVHGENNHFVHLRQKRSLAERERMAELERLRDEWFKDNPLPWDRPWN